MKMIKIFTSLIFVILSFTVTADNKKLPIPRFASIKSNEVNARRGPTTKSAIEWIFIKKGEPIEIIAEYEQWREVRDFKNEGGWIHSSMLSGKRSIIINSPKEVGLTKTASPNSKAIAKLKPNVRCRLKECKLDYCRVSCNHYIGWLPKTLIWGVYKDEKV
jgi:SH3-like domain-containing protein